jgi:L-ascorbate metabolism protein UlaG (beta-lactamase superfamily)
MNPEQSAQAAEDLRAQAALPSHVGRFNISYHSWDDPFKRFLKASENKPYRPVTPKIGGAVRLAADDQVFSRWWE